jgi:hypothetical protein
MERREHPRLPFWLPVEVDGLEAGVAVSHDASDNGLLLVCKSEVPVGTRLRIKLAIPPGAGSAVVVPVEARVVRSARNEQDPHGLWPFKAAVTFEEPVPLLMEYLAGLATPAAR